MDYEAISFFGLSDAVHFDIRGFFVLLADRRTQRRRTTTEPWRVQGRHRVEKHSYICRGMTAHFHYYDPSSDHSKVDVN